MFLVQVVCIHTISQCQFDPCHQSQWHLRILSFILSLPQTPTKVVSSNSAQARVYSMQHYVFVNDLRQVGGFLQVFRFPPPIKLTVTIYLKYC